MLTKNLPEFCMDGELNTGSESDCQDEYRGSELQVEAHWHRRDWQLEPAASGHQVQGWHFNKLPSHHASASMPASAAACRTVES